MEKKQIIIVSCLLIAISGLMYYWFTKSIPTKQEGDQLLSGISGIDSSLISKLESQRLSELKIYGNVPVVVDKNILGKADPFSN